MFLRPTYLCSRRFIIIPLAPVHQPPAAPTEPAVAWILAMVSKQAGKGAAAESLTMFQSC
jgi:hypothetical protein